MSGHDDLRDHDDQLIVGLFVRAFNDVTQELWRAHGKFPTWPVDPLHALAVLSEEYGELAKATLQHVYEPEKASLSDVRNEAVQTAAMALRFMMSIDSYRFQPSAQHIQGQEP
jgi:NTP pyrophosphatase (non-canonical NTP hydrolase)